MRIAIDTEFIEDGRTIDLLSIALVKETGESYYAEVAGVDTRRADDWVKKHVLPLMKGATKWVKTKQQIAEEIVEFVGADPVAGGVEFWAYFADYDWVALCQLFGKMIDLPDGWPMFCRDLNQVLVEDPSLRVEPQQSGEHNALQDAMWVMDSLKQIDTKIEARKQVDTNRNRFGRPLYKLDYESVTVGVYRHYKGGLYQVLGLVHDASDDDRVKVLYFGLGLDAAHEGPRMAVRELFEWHDVICTQHPDPQVVANVLLASGGNCLCSRPKKQRRFTYLGPVFTKAMLEGEDE